MKKNCFEKTCYCEFLIDKYDIANITTYPRLEGTVLISWNFIIFNKRNVLHVLSILLCIVTQSCPTLCNPMDCGAYQSMEFSRQEYWSGLPCPAPGDLPNPGVEPRSPALQMDSLPSEPTGKHEYFVIKSLKFLVQING